jgi:hypothetical protein
VFSVVISQTATTVLYYNRENIMEPNAVDPRELRRELIILTLCIVVFVLILVGLRAFIYSYVDHPIIPTDAGTIDTKINSTPARELTGTVVAGAVEEGYLRIAVPGEGVYSVGVTLLDKRIVEKMLADQGSAYTFIVSAEAATGAFDYEAHAVGSNDGTQSVEERVKQLELIGKTAQ